MITTLAAQNWGMFVLRGVLALALGVLAFAAPGADARGADLRLRVLRDLRWRPRDGARPRGSDGPRWLLVAGGIVGIAIGAYTLFSPQVTAVALVLLIGSFAIVRGVAEVGTAIWLRNFIQSAWLYVLSGIVSIVFGAYLIVAPGDGALAVLFVIGFYALFAGVMYIAIGLQPPRRQRDARDHFHDR